MLDADEGGRRGRLRGVKLAALVRQHLGAGAQIESGAFPPGAALVAAGAAWVLVEDEPIRGLGPALAWAHRRTVDAVHVLAEDDTGALARRAGAFATSVRVWQVDGRDLHPAEAQPLPVPPAPQPEHLAVAETIRAGGATPLVEHGVVTGDVRGLEVCRVVDDRATGSVRLEVGIGVHDREAFALLHGDIPTVEALAGVVDAVERHRRPEEPQHPLNRLAQDRLLRWRLTVEPQAVGLAEVAVAEPPLPGGDLRRAVPCVARGIDPRGHVVVVVCSVGVDLDVIPFATDARIAVARTVGTSAEDLATIVVTPPRDQVPVTAELAATLHRPVRLVSPSWSTPRSAQQAPFGA